MVGPNGAGKSTLLKVLAGLYPLVCSLFWQVILIIFGIFLLFSIKTRLIRWCNRRHQQIGEPQRQTIDYHQRVGIAVLRDGLRQFKRFFNGLHTGYACGPILFVLFDALYHLVVPGLRSGNQHRFVPRCLREPGACQHFSATRFATALAAEYELAPRYDQFSHFLDPSP